MIGLDWIAQQEYLGRGFILGRTQDEKDFAAYFVTGRSPPSRQRKFVELKDGTVKTLPTNLKAPIDPEMPLSEEAKQEIKAKGGNPSLLIYNALRGNNGRLVVSNGAQTDLISNNIVLGHLPVVDLLYPMASPFFVDDIDLTKFEPDAPNYTSRITGVISKDSGAIAIVRNTRLEAERSFFDFNLTSGFGKFVSTYTGQNVPKGVTIPSFQGEPLDFLVEGNTLADIARNLYDSLGPKTGNEYLSPGEDFRVGVAAAYLPKVEEKLKPCIINRG
ncbi:MAG: IMP cyclohydrolase [Nanoarchaeota archaeon]